MTPRRITFREGMSMRSLAEALNEWTRDVADALARPLDFAERLKPTRIVTDSYNARPWDCVIVDASKKAMDVTLPRATDARGRMVAVINISASTNAITVKSGGPADKINGAATHTIAEGHGHRFFYSTGEDWYTLGPRVSDTGEAIAASGGASLLWEWNGTDTSQFEASHAFASATGAVSPSLSVTPTSTWPNVTQLLRLQDTGGATGAGAIYWLIKAEEFTAPSTYRYVIEAIYNSNGARPGGVAFLCDDSGASFYGHCALTGGGFGWYGRVDAGTRVIEGTTPGWSVDTGDGRALHALDADKAAGTAPRFTMAIDSYFTQVGNRRGFHRHTDYATAYAAGWQSTTPDRVGLALQANGGNTFGVMEIASLRIWKHPRDL